MKWLFMVAFGLALLAGLLIAAGGSSPVTAALGALCAIPLAWTLFIFGLGRASARYRLQVARADNPQRVMKLKTPAQARTDF